MIEYGIFNDEGCLERQFYSVAEAEAVIEDRYDADDEVVVREMCPDHDYDEQPKDGCELCDAEDE